MVGTMTWVTTGEPTIQRQRNHWVVRVAGYDAVTGRRRVRQLGTYSTKKAAVGHQRAIMDGRVGSDDETLSAYLREAWLPSKDARVEVGTYDQYRWAVEGHIIPLLGAVRLRDLTPEAIDRWLRSLVVTPDGEDARLGATSARLVRKILSMAMEDAVRRGRLPRNPVVLTQPPKRSRAHRKLGWTLDECRQFLDGIEEHRMYAAFHLALVTGVRRGELLGLRWGDVDLDAAQIAVVQQLAVERGRPVLKQLKTEASRRVIPIGRATTGLLERHRELQLAEAGEAGSAWEPSGLVFTTQLGGWIDPNNFARLMRDLISSTGVPAITPKGLRHTAQSIGRVVVGDDKVMQERLGHSDIEITLGTYTHVVDEQHRHAGELIDSMFAVPTPSR
jgi:integrase